MSDGQMHFPTVALNGSCYARSTIPFLYIHSFFIYSSIYKLINAYYVISNLLDTRVLVHKTPPLIKLIFQYDVHTQPG